MVILTANKLTLHFGTTEIFNDVSVQIKENSKIGLVGTNGAGKTSLLKVLSGIIDYTSGSISISENTSVNYLSQLSDYTCENTVFQEVMSIFDDIYDMERKMRDLEHQMADCENLDELTDEYNRLVEEFEDINGYAVERLARSVLSGLNIKEDMYDRNISTLSGGQRARVALARALLKKPSLLLLDEPTNHLDMDAINFLENYLNQYKAAFIVVSHDRYFLDKVCGEIYEISMGKLNKYKGNYSDYLLKREKIYQQMLLEYKANQQLIQREQAIINRYRRWGREKSLRAAKSREKRLEKIERIDKPLTENKVSFSFQITGRSGEDVLITKNLSKNFDGTEIFTGLDMHIKSGEKVAIVGANGIGKTTLLKIINKAIPPSDGEFLIGSSVKIGYYDQHQQNLISTNTAIDEIWRVYNSLSHQQIRDTLALFLFRGDDITKEVSMLSGGERARLSLLKLMLSKANFLILDEPTNHLDMDSTQVLEEALKDFPGTVLFVSHDRYFINNIANRVIHMEKDKVTSYPGNWDDYQRHLSLLRNDKLNDNSINKTQKAKLLKKQRETQANQKKRKQALKALENDIEDLEKKIADIENILSSGNISADEINTMSKEHQELSSKLEETMEKWTEEMDYHL